MTMGKNLKMIEKYDGHIVRFVSNQDILDAGVRDLMYETAGEKIVIKMEKAIQWMVLIKGTQAKILAELKESKDTKTQIINHLNQFVSKRDVD